MVVRGGMRGFRFFMQRSRPLAGPMLLAGGLEGIGYAVHISPPVEVYIDGFLDVCRGQKRAEGDPQESTVTKNSRVNAYLRGDLKE